MHTSSTNRSLAIKNKMWLGFDRMYYCRPVWTDDRALNIYIRHVIIHCLHESHESNEYFPRLLNGLMEFQSSHETLDIS